MEKEECTAVVKAVVAPSNEWWRERVSALLQVAARMDKAEADRLAASLKPAGVAMPRALPHPASPEASAMMDALLAEYQHPANTKNAARAGWEAANRWLTLGAAISATHLSFCASQDDTMPGYPTCDCGTDHENTTRIRELVEALCSAAVSYGECDSKDAENAYYAAKAHLIGAVCAPSVTVAPAPPP
jgi:hypothetical protein